MIKNPGHIIQYYPEIKGWRTVFNLRYSIPTGILRDKTMADKLMYIPNDNKQNYTLYRLQLLVGTFRHSIY